MQFWNFALFGVTGDLARRKILPALSAFASKNINDVVIDLTGYSRSQANEEEIQEILNASSTKPEHAIRSIRYIQGEYSDETKIRSLIDTKEEHAHLYIYLALPPQIIVEFLSIIGPLYDKKQDKKIHIIIEKPFGRNSTEALSILQLVDKFKLQNRVYFIDHYMFKSEVRLSDAEKSNFRSLFEKPIESISIRALEVLGVEDRKSYYNETGAFKDMFIHLYSLLMITLTTLHRNTGAYVLHPQQISKGQYSSFLSDIQEQESSADTYFALDLILEHAHSSLDSHKTHVVFESGKKLADKKTHIVVTFSDGAKLEWNIAPKYSLKFEDQENMIQLTTPHSPLSDHENMFSDLLLGETQYFISEDQMKTSWEVFDVVSELEGFNTIDFVYSDGRYPIVEIEDLIS